MGDRALVLTALALAAGPCGAAEEIPVLRIIQRVEGFPGLGEDQATTVVLAIARDRLVASRSSDGTLFIVRLDKDRMYEIAPNRKAYTESVELRERQRDRDLFEKQLVSYLRELANSDAEYKEALAKHHLRADGRRIASVEEPEGAEEFQIEGLSYSARRVVVTENGRRIIDAWYAPPPQEIADLARQIEFYEFYRRLGCFSDEVLAVLRTFTRDRPGIPLEAQIRVVTATLNQDLKARTISIARTTVPATLFEVPPGAVRVDEEKAVVRCALPGCQKEVETAAPAGGKWRDRHGTWFYFCSPEHRARFVKERIAKEREEAAPPKG